MVEELTTYIAHAPPARMLNLGSEYNRLMEASPTEWVCFLDHDAMWLKRDWYQRLLNGINYDPGVGMLSVQSNRIGLSVQRIPKSERIHNISVLRRQAMSQTGKPMEVKDQLSGVVIVTSKSVWNQVGGFSDGFLGVDWQYCQKVREYGYKLMLLRDNPVYHWYRADGDKEHVTQANAMYENHYKRPLV